jgi:hypothetical protein
MGKALIKIRSKPRKPRRRNVSDMVEVYDGQSLQEVINFLKADPSQITFDINYGDPYDCCGYGGGGSVYAKFSRPQTDEEYEEDMKRFRERKRKYDAWYSENKELIEREIQRRKDEAVARKERVMKKERERLEKELAKLQKKLRGP